MLNVDDAYRKLISTIEPVSGHEVIRVPEALDRITASDIQAPVDLPPFNSSAMDGYAVSTEAFTGSGQLELSVIGESLAGHPTAEIVSGKNAIRIFTGAVIPQGADAIVLQEDVERHGDTVVVKEAPTPSQHVRPRGHDIQKNATIVASGSQLDAYRLSWLTACGVATVAVKPCVTVAVFSTGDELVDVGRELAPGQIYDSNRFALTQLMSDQPARVIDIGCVPDDRDSIREALEQAASEADIIVTSGGVSVGDADFVRDVVEDIGQLDFWKIAMKPGKPLAVGKIGNADFFGLPGNPVSTIVTYLLFVAPAICARAGGRPRPPLELSARLSQQVSHSPGRREYQRGIARNDGDGLTVSVTGDQSSNRLATFDGANCLIKVPDESGDIAAGERVTIILLSGNRGRLF